MNNFTRFALVSVAVMTIAGASASTRPTIKAFTAPVSTLDTEFSEDDIIFDQPEGEYTLLWRDCDGFTKEAFSAVHSTVLGSTVEMVQADESTVYLNHIVSEYPVGTWVKATRDGDKLTVSGPQPIYVEYDEDTYDSFIIYLVPMSLFVEADGSGTFKATEDMDFVFNINEDGTLTAADPAKLLGICVESANQDLTGPDKWVWRGFGDRNIKMGEVRSTTINPPADVTLERWVWSDPYEVAFVNVAIDGNDIYLSGMNRAIPDAWVKGSIDDNRVIIPSGQYMGPDFERYYLNYFWGAEVTEGTDPETGEEQKYVSMTDAAVFSYDADNKRLVQEGFYMINSTPEQLYPLTSYSDVVVEAQNRNPEAAPAAPYDLVVTIDEYWGECNAWFMIPTSDVDGKMIDPDNLYYEVFIDDQPLEITIYDSLGNDTYTSLIPYAYQDWDIYVDGPDHTVYFYTFPAESVKVQSVYFNEEGKELRSTPAVYSVSAIESINSNSEVISREYFDLQGRRISRPGNGVVISVTTYSDGHTVNEKVIR